MIGTSKLVNIKWGLYPTGYSSDQGVSWLYDVHIVLRRHNTEDSIRMNREHSLSVEYNCEVKLRI